MLIKAEPLRRFVAPILSSAGAETTLAEETADRLVLADLKGHDSHGVGMVPSYVGLEAAQQAGMDNSAINEVVGA